MNHNIINQIASEISARPQQVLAAVNLLDEGITVPFIARYRKEVTDGLDDTQLRLLEERLLYLRELEARRSAILDSLREQDALTEELEKKVLAAETKTRLEDLYAPFKPKRRTKAQIAREAGIEPLADALLDNPTLTPETEAAAYLNAEAGFADEKSVLDGAKQILMERFAEQADLLAVLRDKLWSQGVLKSQVAAGKESEGQKFRDYFEYQEAIKRVPSHRALALFRGRNEGVLQLQLELPADEGAPHPCEVAIARSAGIDDQGRAADKWLNDTVRWTWRIKVAMKLELDLFGQLREQAEAEAIRVFAANLKDLLMAAPAGPKATMGLDPGLRTGVKVAVVDATGKLLDTDTIYPHVPRNDWKGALIALAKLAQKHRVELVAIGNGTGSRETDKLVADLIKHAPGLGLSKLVVSEAGASVYSASQYAAQEFPGLDVSLRGAVSIARRLQDPLAELVKIEPKAIGVGQYQHDVNQFQLARALDGVVEDCVNAVGVDVNMASSALLSRVAGLSASVAQELVAYRDSNGVFSNRKQLLKVPRLGDKTFEQAAGFLRITGGDNPLDSSAVHPESYSVVEAITAQSGQILEKLVGNANVLKQLRPQQFVTDQIGLPTIKDIFAELEKPGRDPRPEFKTASFQEGVESIGDLRPGMTLEGVVSNVANFGAFVDIGVHQDGLVHVSALADKFVKDPRDVVSAGQVVKVKVLEVEPERQRIALTMRLSDPVHRNGKEKKSTAPLSAQAKRKKNELGSSLGGSMAAAFNKAKN